MQTIWGQAVEYKNARFEIKEQPGESGEFSGYASVFNEVDLGLDTVAPGAFAKSIASRVPKMLWQHDTDKVIGVWQEVREDAKGLFVRGKLLSDIQKGREAIALLKAGALDSMSIGYRTVQAEPDGRLRKLTEVELFEVSLVTFPMDEKAKVTDVKSIQTEREFEAFLREAGYSRKEAAAITLHGFKAIAGQRDAGPDEGVSEGVKALLSQLGQLQERFHV